MKKHAGNVRLLFLSLLLILSLTACGHAPGETVTGTDVTETVQTTESVQMTETAQTAGTTQAAESTRETETLPATQANVLLPRITLRTDAVEYSLMNERVARYMADPDVTKATKYAQGAMEYSHPAPVGLNWTVEDARDVVGFTVLISETADPISDERCLSFPAEKAASAEQHADIVNLKSDMAYSWTVIAEMPNGVSAGTDEVGHFVTKAQEPRFIDCGGVTNMRDLGGWMTEDGQRIRQGLLYRCGRLNSSSTETLTLNITDSGLRVMKQLGIRSEIDLRRTDNNEVGGLTESVLEGVRYFSCPMNGTTGELFTNGEMLREVLGILAESENYPLIYHCNIGTDRTGYVSYVVGALLGMSQEDLQRDYLLSNFASINGPRKLSRIADDYVAGIDAFPGQTLQEKAEAYVLSLGVTEEEIASLREILLEG